ncbi:AAA family ATPase [Streptomyces sp. NPDC059373]
MNEWLIYRGSGEPHDGISDLPAPPPWRQFDGGPTVNAADPVDTTSTRRLGSYLAQLHRPDSDEVELINAALYLRRPLLVTGEPGSGKSTLAHAVAHELKLGKVLHWPIVSRTTLHDGLYEYDAIGRLQDLQLSRDGAEGDEPDGAGAAGARSAPDIGRYIRLGPLGTALLPTERPRVLLVDELDKSDIDLPNDLLNALEEGEFSIPELERQAERVPEATVLTHDGHRVVIRGGRVRCRAFPFVIFTSNGERDFPAPLLRRCLHLQLQRPDEVRLGAMVQAHFGEGSAERHTELIRQFLDRAPGDVRAADQLLNAIYLTMHAAPEEFGSRERLAERLMRPLDSGQR